MNTTEKKDRINKARSSFNNGIVGILGLLMLFTWMNTVQAETNEYFTCVTRGDERKECTPLPCPPPPTALKVDLEPYQSVAAILTKVKQSDNLVDTIHRNPFVLEAAGLFLDLEDSNGLPEEGQPKTATLTKKGTTWTVTSPQQK